MSEAQDTDLLLVNRNGTSYKQEIDTMRDRIADTDLLLIYRGNQAYKITGEDFIDSTQEYAPPVITNVVLSEDSPGGTRFANQDFNVTYNMLSDGTPDSNKLVKPYVIGGISLFGQTSAITEIVSLEYSSNPITGSPYATTGGFEWWDTFNPPSGAPNNSYGAFSNAAAWNSYKITFDTPITGSSIQILLTNGSSTDWGYNDAQVNDSSTNSAPVLYSNGLNYVTTLTATTLNNISTGYNVGISGVIVDGNLLIDSDGYTLTLTNDQDLNYFEVGDVVLGGANLGGINNATQPTTITMAAGTWSDMVQQFATTPSVNTSTAPWCYASAVSQVLTLSYTGTGTIKVYGSTGSTVPSASCAVSGDVTETTTVFPAGAEGSQPTPMTFTPNKDSGTFSITMGPIQPLFMGFQGSPAITVTSISPSTPSMNVDGGTWAVGNTINNTVERQEQVVLSTDDITAIASISSWNQDKVWSNSLSGVSTTITGTLADAFNGSELASAPIYLGAGDGDMLLTFSPALSGTVTCLASSAGGADPTNCKVVLNDGQDTPITAGYGASAWSSPLTITSLSSITFTGSAVNGVALAAVKVNGQLLVNTGISGSPTFPRLTFATDDQLDNFQVGWSVKQDAPVTPVTSAITNVVTTNATGITATPVPSFLTQATSGTHSGTGWPEVIGLSPSTTNVDEYWCMLPDGGGSQKGTITYANMTVGDTITVRGFGAATDSRSCGGDISEIYASVTAGSFGTSSAPPSFTVTTTATDGTFYVDFNGVFNLFGISPGPGGDSHELTFTDDTQLDNFQAGDAVTGPVTGTGVLPPTTVPANLQDAYNQTGSTLQAQAWAAFTADLTTTYTFVGVTSPAAFYYMSVPYQGTVTVNYIASAVGESFTWGFATANNPTLTLGGDVSNPGDTVITTNNINSPQPITITVSKTSGAFTLTAPTDPANSSLFLYSRSAMGNVSITSANVTSTTPASNQMTVSGGTLANGQTVTGPVIDGTGNVVSTDPSAKTMDIDSGRFAIGSEVETVNEVPNPEVKLFCITSSTGSITDLSQADPGYTTMSTVAVLQTLTFPASFPSGVAADTELPVGTTLAVDVQASNIIGTVSATTNVVTPTT